MTERLPCNTPGCARTILASTAEETGGFCMPCVQRMRARDHAEYVAAHRVDVDRFAGVTNPVDILLLIHQPPPRDELKNELPYPRKIADLYRSLSQGEVDRLLSRAANDEGLIGRMASYVAAFSLVDLTPSQLRLLDRTDYPSYPAHVFRDAAQPVVDRLFELLDRAVRGGSDLLLSHVLSALAWTRSARIIEAVTQWQKAPPAWSALLHWPPQEYTKLAGYEVEDGRVRALFVPGAMGLVCSGTGSRSSSGKATLLEPDPRGKPCPRCRKQNRVLIRLEPGSAPGEFQRRGLLFVPTCLECACYEPLAVSIAADGRWEWIHAGGGSTVPESGYSREISPITTSLAPRPDWEAVDWCSADGISQVGGHPSWINDPSYPPCPKCSRSMMTVAQVGLGDFFSAEGVYYVHHCEACAVVSVTYEQT